MIPARVNFSNQKPCTNLKWIFCHHSRFCRHMTAVWAIVWLTQPWSSLDGLLSSLASILEAFSLILENGGNQSVKTLLKWCMKSCRFIRVWTYLIKEEHGEVHPSLVNHDIIAWTERSNPHFSTSDISWFNLMGIFLINYEVSSFLPRHCYSHKMSQDIYGLVYWKHDTVLEQCLLRKSSHF